MSSLKFMNDPDVTPEDAVKVINALAAAGVSGQMAAGAAAVVEAAGVVSVAPADVLNDPHVVRTLDGISTLTPIDIAAPGTYRKVRLYWRNISAAPERKLFIAANAENAVRGLQQSQDGKRRVAELAFGDHIMLVCPSPISGLTFSSDGAVTVSTHSLLILWGN